ncbi:MAG TPA: type II secretion system F family protein [Solirubrobacteraceae bacterium]|nr:type II secretion system F family protein [Solirubrobacteraceae bacterium]
MPASVLAALAGVCAVLAAWEAIAAAEEERLVRSAAQWLAPGLRALRAGHEPTNRELRRLVLVGLPALVGAGWLVGSLLLGLGLAVAAPWALRAGLRVRRRRRRAAIGAAAPAIARALADALSGGHSVRGALAAVAGAGGVPGFAGEELRRVATQLELGERTEDVLVGLARRSGPGPLDTLVAAVLLHRDAGGDLAGLLRSLARALEDHGRTVADARSATAQARFTALLVCGMPVAGIALGELARPGLIISLVTAPLPGLLTAVAVVLQVVAFVCVRRIARVGEQR